MIFFFKQKTSYEMRISDWSSDVCSSDLDRQSQIVHQRVDLGRHLFRAEVAGADVDADGERAAGLLRRAGEAAQQHQRKIVDRLEAHVLERLERGRLAGARHAGDRKSTRLNSSH